MSWALPRARSSNRRCARAWAEELADAVAGAARPDPEVDTTWHVTGVFEGRPVDLDVGAPRLRRGIFGSERRAWMVVEIRGPTWLPAGTVLRPAARTVWEWREGLPGETREIELGPGSGVGYLLRPAILLASHRERVRGVVEALPRWALVEVRDDFVWMRASAVPAVGPAKALAELLDWYARWAAC